MQVCDHLQLIKFWWSCAPGRGPAAGWGWRNFGSALLQPSRTLCVYGGTAAGAQCLRLSERFFINLDLMHCQRRVYIGQDSKRMLISHLTEIDQCRRILGSVSIGCYQLTALFATGCQSAFFWVSWCVYIESECCRLRSEEHVVPVFYKCAYLIQHCWTSAKTSFFTPNAFCISTFRLILWQRLVLHGSCSVTCFWRMAKLKRGRRQFHWHHMIRIHK